MKQEIDPQELADLVGDKLLDRKQLGVILGLSPMAIVQLEIRHNLPIKAIKLGRAVRYRLSDVRAYIANGNGGE